MRTFTLLTLLSATLPTVLAACTQFDPFVTYVNINANVSASETNSTFPPVRISNIVDCNATASNDETCPTDTCLLTTVSSLLIRVNRQLDLDVPEEVADDIFNLIRPDLPASANVNTNASLVYSAEVGGVSYCLERGTSAWFTFTPWVACVMGTLSGCTGDGVEDGTVIRGCGVQVREGTVEDEIPVLSPGEIEIVREPAGRAEGPPANAPLEGTQSSGAVRTFGVDGEKVLNLLILTGVLGLGMVL